jgi:hypothetical protein
MPAADNSAFAPNPRVSRPLNLWGIGSLNVKSQERLWPLILKLVFSSVASRWPNNITLNIQNYALASKSAHITHNSRSRSIISSLPPQVASSHTRTGTGPCYPYTCRAAIPH